MQMDIEHSLNGREQRRERQQNYTFNAREYRMKLKMEDELGRLLSDEEREALLLQVVDSSDMSVLDDTEDEEALMWEGGPARITCLSHSFMAIFLVLLIALQVRDYLMTDRKLQMDICYFIVLGLPLSVMLLLFCDIIFEKYIKPIHKWHKIMYARLRNVIVFVTMSGILFLLSASWFMSMPNEAPIAGISAITLYYLIWLSVTVAFCFVSPGIIDKEKGLPCYRIVLWLSYLVFFFAYPLLLIDLIIKDQKENSVAQAGTLLGKQSAALANVPVIVLAALHMLVVLPQIFTSCRDQN